MITALFACFSGLLILVVGAEVLIRGAVRLSRLFGLSPLVIGLTVVAYGTSMPEFVVSVMASLESKPEIALGNVVGSNIVNILLILGISALIRPQRIHLQLIKLDVPVMIGVSLLLLFWAWLLPMNALAGGVFLLLGIAYTVWQVKLSGSSKEFEREYGETVPRTTGNLFKAAGLSLLGILILQQGSRLLIGSAVEIAAAFGVSDLVIGLTLVALGTSLPELFTSVVAALRKESDIAVGNIVGSNIFNILFVLGASLVVAPENMTLPREALFFDIPVMAVVAILCLPLFLTSKKLGRFEGVLFLSGYAAYTATVLYM